MANTNNINDTQETHKKRLTEYLQVYHFTAIHKRGTYVFRTARCIILVMRHVGNLASLERKQDLYPSSLAISSHLS